ncbi:hypothetical protein I551_9051 [Mycobacterium ulcerans str. Harvey]|uniref:Uncharacterized protein n=1 Tax=Mycobacterium ulcerans str. Harvey TaxID=1299332 RepID=A0ABN0R950_MYCUL|nr:hypothetical protein I551_9051 [Mycobacterium ulcerans str. Harvey]
MLDFVIALVRDPAAAARYAANPAQAIADAHLTDVTSADVNNLIPMVSDSLSMAGPSGAIAGHNLPITATFGRAVRRRPRWTRSRRMLPGRSSHSTNRRAA